MGSWENYGEGEDWVYSSEIGVKIQLQVNQQRLSATTKIAGISETKSKVSADLKVGNFSSQSTEIIAKGFFKINLQKPNNEMQVVTKLTFLNLNFDSKGLQSFELYYGLDFFKDKTKPTFKPNVEAKDEETIITTK